MLKESTHCSCACRGKQGAGLIVLLCLLVGAGCAAGPSRIDRSAWEQSRLIDLNGKFPFLWQATRFAWTDVQGIILTKEALGFGWFIVNGRGTMQILIQRSLQLCGAFLYQLKWHTNLYTISRSIMLERS